MITDTVMAAAERHRRLAAFLTASGRWAIALAALSAALSLVGWLFDFALLARFVPGWPMAKPISAVPIIATAGAFALLLSARRRRRAAGVLVLALVALVVLAGMLLPQARSLPGGALQAYAGSALLLIIAGTALVTAPGTRQVPAGRLLAGRLLAAASAALLFVALIGISFRLLLTLPPLVNIALPALIALLLLAYAVVVVRPDAGLLERLTNDRPGAVITRRLFPAALLLPLVIGWLEVAAVGGGVLDSAFGAVLQTVATMAALGALVLWVARRVDRLDARRNEAEQALRLAYAELDRRVEERTAELERANAALHESLALLRGVAESTPDLIAVKDTVGRIVMANPAHIKAIGKDESRIVGHTDADFIDDAQIAARIAESDRAVMSLGRVERVEQTLPTPEGPRTYLATKSPLRDVKGNVIGVIVVGTDISERKRMENELRDAQRFTQGLVETAPIVLYLFDQRERRIVYASGMGLQALGYTPADLTDRDRPALESLVHEDDLEKLIGHLRREPLAGGVREVEFRCRTRSGEWRWLHGRERAYERGETNQLFLGVTVDITDRKQAELERERLMAAEQRLRVDAERANRAKDEFLAIVSHELRSPLNALRGWGFLLGSAKAPDADLIERATQAIKRNVDHQARLIEDLLDTSRIMSGKLNIERRPLNLVEVLQPAVESVKQAAAAKRITVEFTKERPAITLEGDAARLHQIAVNLLTNAVKFTPEGGEVKVVLESDAGIARLAVTDTGAGIAPEFLPRVFDRFTQADTSTTRRYGGLGIGLALVRHLTELHGGKVSAQSDGAGQGSTFTVELPLAEPRQADAAALTTAAATSPTSGGLAGVNICALDDDPDARDVISLTLTQAGAEVRTVSSGAELIAWLDSALPAARPDVLLMDLAMPDEDGFTVLARVRTLETSKAVPVGSAIPAIAVTAFTEVSRERVLEQGFIDHVAKPIDPARLVASIRQAMRAHGG